MIDSIEQTAEWAVLTFSGVVTPEDMLQARAETIDNAHYPQRKYHIWCFKSVTQIQLDQVAMERISHEDIINWKINPGLRVALVADTDVAFGMCRMYQGHADELWAMKVFRRFDDALLWCQSE
ncbi:MAG: hypothetical protein OIF55_02320 [Amphritea sp.]|nr:hypothetical protein [Amphritea sp.]